MDTGNRKLAFALIGCGRIAQRHAAMMQPYGHLQAVCDLVPEKANILAKKYKAHVYTDIETLLLHEKGLDLIAICTPNGLHAMHSILCLEKGFHVLCEKPMALSVADCSQMMEAADKNDRMLFVVKQNRFNPPVLAVKNLLDKNAIGKIASMQLNCFWNRAHDYYKDSWKGTKDLDGGILFTQFSHFIDLVYWFLGEVACVTAYCKNFLHEEDIAFEDTCVAIANFASGVLGTMHFTINSFEKNMEGSLTLFGEKGTIKIGGQYLNELEYQQTSGGKITSLPAGNPPNEYGHYTGSMSNHDKVYALVCIALQQNKKITTNAFDSMKTIAIIEKIYNAATANGIR